MITYPSTHGVFEEHRARGLRHRARARRPGLHGRREHERAGRPHLARRDRRRRLPPQPAQDLLRSRTAAAARAWARSAPAEHLAPSCPGIPSTAGRDRAVSAAPYGSPSILPISWVYIALMGADGAHARHPGRDPERQLHGHRGWPSTTTCSTRGPAGASRTSSSSTAAPSRRAGVRVEDIAKRLMDYGFHAPTMSFPVAGTLMIEPTESESKREEIDRLCDALIAIRAEIRAIEEGELDRERQPPQERAPHRRSRLASDDVAAPLFARARRLSGTLDARVQVLAGRSAASTTPTATATCSARVRRWRRHRPAELVGSPGAVARPPTREAQPSRISRVRSSRVAARFSWEPTSDAIRRVAPASKSERIPASTWSASPTNARSAGPSTSSRSSMAL